MLVMIIELLSFLHCTLVYEESPCQVLNQYDNFKIPISKKSKKPKLIKFQMDILTIIIRLLLCFLKGTILLETQSF